MTYYDRIRNRNDRSIYESPEEKEERIRRMKKKKKYFKQNNLYKCERREEEGV